MLANQHKPVTAATSIECDYSSLSKESIRYWALLETDVYDTLMQLTECNYLYRPSCDSGWD